LWARLCLRGAFSSIGQPIEIASQDVQPCLDGSCCHSFCGPAGLGGFLAVISRWQRRRVFGLVHEPKHNGAARELRASRWVPTHAARSIITRDAIHVAGDRAGRLSPLDLGERPCYPHLIPFPLLISRPLRDQRPLPGCATTPASADNRVHRPRAKRGAAEGGASSLSTSSNPDTVAKKAD
jgi:hypothetical protein